MASFPDLSEVKITSEPPFLVLSLSLLTPTFSASVRLLRCCFFSWCFWFYLLVSSFTMLVNPSILVSAGMFFVNSGLVILGHDLSWVTLNFLRSSVLECLSHGWVDSAWASPPSHPSSSLSSPSSSFPLFHRLQRPSQNVIIILLQNTLALQTHSQLPSPTHPPLLPIPTSAIKSLA